MHLPHLLSALPMSWAEAYSGLQKLGLLRTQISFECPHFVPLQGEWTGTKTAGMLLSGRRGQVANWNPFDSHGNYNVVVSGRSGSGKSVFMQDLLVSGLSSGAKVFVIDVGRSFEKLCGLLGGQQIEFSLDSSICLNPFSRISESKEERDAEFSFLKSIIGCMSAPTQGTTDYQNAIIERAVIECWKAKGNQTTITDISNLLSSQKDKMARELGVLLTPFSKDGIYGKYFNGESTVDFHNQMVLIELEELKDKKDLQAVVLQLFIMAIANQAFLGDRKTPFFICIDEAWDLLRAPQAGAFIETLARRLRKYNGSLVVGTQSIEDFFSTPGAQAAYQNSDWMCFLSQKNSSIKSLEKGGNLEFQNMGKALESVHTRQGEYSEVMIVDAEANYFIERLLLDPFSKLLYSTKAEDHSRIEALREKGLSVSEAIDSLTRRES